MCWMEVCKYVLASVCVCSASLLSPSHYSLLPFSDLLQHIIGCSAIKKKNSTETHSASFFSFFLITVHLNRNLPMCFPPTLCGVKHASNLPHDDHSAKWGVVNTLQIVKSVPLWEQVLSVEKLLMTPNHMITIWRCRNIKFFSRCQKWNVDSCSSRQRAALDTVWVIGSISSCCQTWEPVKAECCYADISFGICCIFEVREQIKILKHCVVSWRL